MLGLGLGWGLVLLRKLYRFTVAVSTLPSNFSKVCFFNTGIDCCQWLLKISPSLSFISFVFCLDCWMKSPSLTSRRWEFLSWQISLEFFQSILWLNLFFIICLHTADESQLGIEKNLLLHFIEFWMQWRDMSHLLSFCLRFTFCL